jgi:hypothetical protein
MNLAEAEAVAPMIGRAFYSSEKKVFMIVTGRQEHTEIAHFVKPAGQSPAESLAAKLNVFYCEGLSNPACRGRVFFAQNRLVRKTYRNNNAKEVYYRQGEKDYHLTIFKHLHNAPELAALLNTLLEEWKEEWAKHNPV